MKIKNLLLIAMAAIIAAPVYAQKPMKRHKSIFEKDERVYYGVRLGMTSSFINTNISAINGNNNVTGLSVGIVAGIKAHDNYPVIIEGGLSYVERGCESKKNGVKITYDLNYLLVPVVAKYKIEFNSFNSDFSIQPFFGGYLSLGISGKCKNYEKLESFSSYGGDHFQRFDGGLRFGCGFEYNMVYAELGYDLGLSNISNDDFTTARNRSFFMNVGVNF